MTKKSNKLKHWIVSTDQKGILSAALDKADSSTNVLSSDVLNELDSILADVEKEVPTAVIFKSAKTSGFIAGADINEFLTIKNTDEALTFIRRGQAIFDRIENLPCPTIAVIEGFLYGRWNRTGARL